MFSVISQCQNVLWFQPARNGAGNERINIMVKKSLAIALTASALTVGGAATLGVTQNSASADTNNTTLSQSSSDKSDKMTDLINALAKKFNLKKADVQAVFDEQHSKMDAQREVDFKANLSRLVKDGKLTQAQADAITAKQAEIKNDMEAKRKSGTKPSESEMQSKRTELDEWFSDKNIPSKYHYLVMGKHHGGPGGRHGFEERRSNGTGGGANEDSSQSPSNTAPQTN